MTQRMKFTYLLVAWAGLLGTLGCADKTVDDWRKEQAEKKAAEINAVSGVYRGMLVSAANHSALAALAASAALAPMEVLLDVERTVGQSGDGLGSEQKTALGGRVTLYGGINAVLPFGGGFFGSSDGTVKATATISMSNGEKAAVEISGKISDRVFSGRMMALNYPEGAAEFVLTRDGELPESGASRDDKPSSAIGGTEIYVGTMDSQYETPIFTQMTISSAASTSEEQVLGLFYKIRVVNIFVLLDNVAQASFQNVRMDSRTGRFKANGLLEKVPAELSCEMQIAATWTCRFTSQGGVAPMNVVFKPKAVVDSRTYRGLFESAVKGAAPVAMEVVAIPQRTIDMEYRITLRQKTDQTFVFSRGKTDLGGEKVDATGSLSLSNGEKLRLRLSGSARGGELSGQLELPGTDVSRTLGTFNLRQDAEFPEVPPQASKPGEFLPGLASEFVGSAVLPGDKNPTTVEMKMLPVPRTQEEDFLSKIYPLHLVDVKLDFSSGAQMRFFKAKADLTKGVLRGTGYVGSGSGTLLCAAVELGAWSCQVDTSNLKGIKIEFKPKGQIPGGGL